MYAIKRLYRIADLFPDFNINKYRDDPQIDALPHPKITAHYLNQHFSTPNKQLTFPLQLWIDLIDSIPNDWITVIIAGNQTFYQNDFLPHLITNFLIRSIKRTSINM